MVEAILANKRWGAAEWDGAYEDLPNKLLKVEVADRNIFVAEDAERKLASPEGLQKQIDAEVSKVNGGRSFVRPSGTEDCVRVYAEAATAAETDCE
jgi:phosphoacetylglucosamine mutase